MTPKTALRHAWLLTPAGPYVVVGLLGAAEARAEQQSYRDEASPAELATHEHEGAHGHYPVQSASPLRSMAAGATANVITVSTIDDSSAVGACVLTYGVTGPATGPTGPTGGATGTMGATAG